MKTEYQTFIDVPAELSSYLSLDRLNRDYWGNCIDQEQQQCLEHAAREFFDLDLEPYETEFSIETKVEDIATDILPVVPKLCDHQGLILIWTTPLHAADAVVSSALQFKTEPQSVKSTVPDRCEVMIAQVHVYQEFVFVASVKYYNYIAQYPKSRRVELCKMVWQTLIGLFGNRSLYAANGGVLNRAHNLLNNKNIQHEPYNRKMLGKLGFRETTIAAIAEHFYLLPTDKIWKYEH